MNDAFFDLANLSVNCGLRRDADERLLDAVLRRRHVAGAGPGLQLMKVMSEFREGMWAVVQQAISTLDTDFVELRRRAPARTASDSPRRRVRRWLVDARRDPLPADAIQTVGDCRTSLGAMRTASPRRSIIGGGVGGTSIAYHLTQLGWNDIVLVDRDQLTSGSTFHSAGLVGQLRSSVTLTTMMMYGAELYRRLGAETGHDVGWHEVGSLRLASTPERLEELRRQAGWAKTFGLPLDLIGTEEALRAVPRPVRSRPTCSARCGCRPTAGSTRAT